MFHAMMVLMVLMICRSIGAFCDKIKKPFPIGNKRGKNIMIFDG